MGNTTTPGSLSPAPRGILFDYGNTLIPFGQREMNHIAGSLVRFFRRHLPDHEAGAVRDALLATWTELARQRAETNEESDTADVVRLTFRKLGAEASEAKHVPEGLQTVVDSFIEAVDVGEGTVRVLSRLKADGYRIGLLSNYSLGDAIRWSLDKLDLTRWFDDILVSADLGIVKPDPRIFHEGARRLSLSPAEILFVGDNLKMDIAGAAAVGMRTAHIRQHLAGAYHFEHPDENEADVTPDLVLETLEDLIEGD